MEEEESPEEGDKEVTEEPSEEAEEELSPPTINLKIYYGPEFSPSDAVCYYRIEAEVTGDPIPAVEFSKDDSHGSWGERKCQVNLGNTSETYTLAATATNSEGTATDSIVISWGCAESFEEAEAGDGEEEEEEAEGAIEIFEKTPTPTLTINSMVLNPNNIGYIVYPKGINTDTMIVGDSISNWPVNGYFGWTDLSSFSGREIESVTLSLNTHKFWGNLTSAGFCTDIRIYLDRDEIFPLDAGDWWLGIQEIEKSFAITEEPIVWSDASLKNAIKNRIAEGRMADFLVFCGGLEHTDWDYQIDGREYRKQDIRLTVVFGD
jgi:hypothetical protein